LIVIGIDPSSTSTGYGLIDADQRQTRYLDCGCIRPPIHTSFEDRLVFLYDNLTELIKVNQPDEAAVESTFFGKDAVAAFKLGQARGVLLLALRQAGLPISHYTPATVKKAIAGNGQATKDQVRYMIVQMLQLKEVPKPLDASDALAISLCHIHQDKFRSLGTSVQRKPEIEALLKRVVRR
jgi:crossover junction endodeoxyribonuclease RuvC